MPNTPPPLPMGEGWGEGCFRSEKPSPNQTVLTPSIIDTGSPKGRGGDDDDRMNKKRPNDDEGRYRN